MTRYMLDTNILIEISNSPQKIKKLYEKIDAAGGSTNCCISFLTEAEMLFGVEDCTRRYKEKEKKLCTQQGREYVESNLFIQEIETKQLKNKKKLDKIMTWFNIEHSLDDFSFFYAKFKAELMRKGNTNFGECDLIIASQCKALDKILITADQDFNNLLHVGLKVENWLA